MAEYRTQTPKADPRNFPVCLPRPFFEAVWPYLTGRECKVLMALIFHRPRIYPGRKRLGTLTGLGRTSISEAIASLKSARIIKDATQRKRKDGDFDTNEYMLADLKSEAAVSLIGVGLKVRGEPNTFKRRDATTTKRARRA